jgi:uncharacterized protein (DUF433 family)
VSGAPDSSTPRTDTPWAAIAPQLACGIPIASGHCLSIQSRCNLGVMEQPIVSRRSDVMGGTAVFHGTRVPVQTLLDYLEAGESIDDFLEGFPSVTREHVIAFLEEAKDRVIEAAS